MNHMTPDVAGLLQRLERLERQNRLWKKLGLLVVVLLAGAGLVGAGAERSVPAVSAAKEFKLLDDAGNTRARLFMTNAGEPALSFYDQHGKERIYMHINKTGSRFVCLGPSGDRILSAVGTDETGGYVNLWNKANKPIFVSNSKNTAVTHRFFVADAKGRERVRLGVGEQGTEVTCLDPTGKIFLMQIGGHAERGGVITGRDLDGNEIFSLSDKGLFQKK
jgi:hypothetical protein